MIFGHLTSKFRPRFVLYAQHQQLIKGAGGDELGARRKPECGYECGGDGALRIPLVKTKASRSSHWMQAHEIRQDTHWLELPCDASEAVHVAAIPEIPPERPASLPICASSPGRQLRLFASCRWRHSSASNFAPTHEWNDLGDSHCQHTFSCCLRYSTRQTGKVSRFSAG